MILLLNQGQIGGLAVQILRICEQFLCELAQDPSAVRRSNQIALPQTRNWLLIQQPAVLLVTALASSFLVWKYEMEILKIGDHLPKSAQNFLSSIQFSSLHLTAISDISSFPMFLLVTIELPFVNLFSTRSNSSSSFNF